jgi:hypothetical protein
VFFDVTYRHRINQVSLLIKLGHQAG